MPYTDALRAWGSDFQITPTGDLQIIYDVPANPQATIQRIARMIQMCPLLLDDLGNPLSGPDDLFNTTYGAGIRSMIGQNPTQFLIDGVKTHILSGLSSDPYISKNPMPIISVTASNAFLTVIITCTTSTGQPITIPPQQLPIVS